MRESFYLAWRYMAHHRWKTILLVGSITLILYLPAGLQVVVTRTADELATRARTTPLLVGRKGSALELTLNSLYFDAASPERIRMEQVARVRNSGLAAAIPLHVRFHCRGNPIVGTTLDYLDFRGLRIREGRAFAILGECVVGAEVARKLGVGAGGTLVSSPENLFDLAGVYPLEMQVVGVLDTTYGPDDRAIFCDIKTAWVIEGIGHGHQELTGEGVEGKLLERDGDKSVANASVVNYARITADNIDSFHVHGDPSEFPLTAVLALPHDRKSKTILMGRYLGRDEVCQIVEPVKVMDDLIETVFEVRGYVIAAVALVGVSTLVSTVLVFLLSVRLRRREMETMAKIGCSRFTLAALLGSEIAAVVAMAALFAGTLTWLTRAWGPELIRQLIL